MNFNKVGPEVGALVSDLITIGGPIVERFHSLVRKCDTGKPLARATKLNLEFEVVFKFSTFNSRCASEVKQIIKTALETVEYAERKKVALVADEERQSVYHVVLEGVPVERGTERSRAFANLLETIFSGKGLGIPTVTSNIVGCVNEQNSEG